MENKYIYTQGKRLRCGYTTGTCAQAAARAAAIGFFTGDIPRTVGVTIPDGTKLELPVEEPTCGTDEKTGRPFAACAVRKDAGDDMDVTDGMLVFARVMAGNKESTVWGAQKAPEQLTQRDPEQGAQRGPEQGAQRGPEHGAQRGQEQGAQRGPEQGAQKASEQGAHKDPKQGTQKDSEQDAQKDPEQDGIRILGGTGVGRVTKPGLDQPVGEAAINSTPRRMIRAEVAAVREELGEEMPLDVEIFLPDGAERAKKTMNERLGILGGLSILGTTGIVEPQSHRALIETIRAELSMRHAAGERKLLITPGNYGTTFIEHHPELFRTEIAAQAENSVKCSNFIGDTLDAAIEFGFTHVTLVGHIGKLVKLAGGMMNTHSMYGDCRMDLLAACGLKAGVPQSLLSEILDCVTCDDALRILSGANYLEPVMKLMGDRILYHLNYRCKGKTGLRVVVFSNIYGVLVDREEL